MHNKRQKEIQTLLEINTIKDIICKSYNNFPHKPSPIISEMTSKIGSINPKYNNVRQNIYNKLKNIFLKIL